MSDQEQAAMADLLAEALTPRAQMPDWLPAFDDGLIHRLTHCTLCHGQPPTTWGILGLWAASQAYVLCERCTRTDGVRQVEKLFVQRFASTLGQAAGANLMSAPRRKEPDVDAPMSSPQ